MITLFLSGDVMTGRGIDQALPHPSDPEIHEPYAASALDYVKLAEGANGSVNRPLQFSEIWGDALEELTSVNPDARIVNLETSITGSGDWEPKGINYRMSPLNVPCLTAAGIDCCALANNHVLDWGVSGLNETLETLVRAGMKTAGAGRNLSEARAPALLPMRRSEGRLLVFAYGAWSSGVEPHWAATADRPGVNYLSELSSASISSFKDSISQWKRKGDLVIVSLHWGGNWGYEIPFEHKRFARALIDEAGVDLIHGHSSHHALGMEIYRGKLILYGCGDLISDYEGIRGYEEFRSDLGLMYFPTLDSGTGRLLSLRISPMVTRRFRLRRASPAEREWLIDLLNREGKVLGTHFVQREDGSFAVEL